MISIEFLFVLPAPDERLELRSILCLLKTAKAVAFSLKYPMMFYGTAQIIELQQRLRIVRMWDNSGASKRPDYFYPKFCRAGKMIQWL